MVELVSSMIVELKLRVAEFNSKINSSMVEIKRMGGSVSDLSNLFAKFGTAALGVFTGLLATSPQFSVFLANLRLKWMRLSLFLGDTFSPTLEQLEVLINHVFAALESPLAQNIFQTLNEWASTALKSINDFIENPSWKSLIEMATATSHLKLIFKLSDIGFDVGFDLGEKAAKWLETTYPTWFSITEGLLTFTFSPLHGVLLVSDIGFDIGFKWAEKIKGWLAASYPDIFSMEGDSITMSVSVSELAFRIVTAPIRAGEEAGEEFVGIMGGITAVYPTFNLFTEMIDEDTIEKLKRKYEEWSDEYLSRR